MYLEPLFERVQQLGGWVFGTNVEFVLLVDIKNEPKETYRAIREVLEPYGAMLSSFERGKGVRQGAVRILLSGERPIETVSAESERVVFIDGRAPDLDRPIDPELMPWVSDNWEKQFQWRGQGPLPQDESLKLASMVRAAHASASKLRLWSAPDEPVGWQTLLNHGVDILSTDRLSSLREFMLARIRGCPGRASN